MTTHATAMQTDRLELVPMTPTFLRASLRRDSAEAAQHLGLKVPDTWPDIESVLAVRLEQLESNPLLQPWLLRAIAASLGFVRVGDHEDEVDGREDVYAFNVVPPA